MDPGHARRGHTLWLLGLAALLGPITGCRNTALAFGADAPAAQRHLDDVAEAFEARFTNVTRTPKFAYGRMRLARYAFAPSKLVSDTGVWTSSQTTTSGAFRQLTIQAGMTNNQFLFAPRRDVASPVRVGDERHLIEVAQRGADDWAWHTVVEHAVGTMPPARMNDVFRGLFGALERPGSAVRADYRSAFPRTAQSLGRMLRLDSVGAVPQGDGSSLVTTRIRIDGRTLAQTYPEYGKFIQQYIEPARYHWRFTDRAGGLWFEARAIDKLLTIRFRSRGGALQPIEGAARRMPDTLTVTIDGTAKIGMFTVGASDVVGEFVHLDTPRDNAWIVRFTREPHWNLPLIAERLLRAPLRRPFEGRGVYFKIGFRTGDKGQTLSERILDMTVRESAIMRFLGTLGFTAINDYAGKVEEQENRFFMETLSALRTEMAALTR